MILRHFANAHHDGRITSTSPKLTNRDFEAFMAIIERQAGGKVMHFTDGFWQRSADDWLKRMRYRAKSIAAELEKHGKLAANGVGLSGWICKRVGGGTAITLDELEYHGLLVLILGLQSYAGQNAIKLGEADA
jgi:hypothetical protein